MLPSDLLSIGCLTFTAITVFLGSHYLPNRSKLKLTQRQEQPKQPSLGPPYYLSPYINPFNPWNVVFDDPRPSGQQLGFQPSNYAEYRRRRQIDRVLPGSSESALSRFGQTRINATQALVENWRRSILGLIALSERNLGSAEEHFKTGDERRAIQNARTAVENMARAMIHCCGGKPDSDPGQEEVLKMLSQRFKAETKTELDNAIDKIPPMLISLNAKQTLQIASEITSTLKRIVLESFRGEILSQASKTQ